MTEKQQKYAEVLAARVVDFLGSIETNRVTDDGIAQGTWPKDRLAGLEKALRQFQTERANGSEPVEVSAASVGLGVQPDQPWDRPALRPTFCVDKKIDEFMKNMPQDWNGRFFFLMIVKMIETFIAKNTDYAGMDGQKADMLANFREAEDLDVTMVKGILVRAGDKWKRIKNLTKEDRAAMVKDETVVDTMLDLANYMLIAIVAYMETMPGKENK